MSARSSDSMLDDEGVTPSGRDAGCSTSFSQSGPSRALSSASACTPPRHRFANEARLRQPGPVVRFNRSRSVSNSLAGRDCHQKADGRYKLVGCEGLGEERTGKVGSGTAAEPADEEDREIPIRLSQGRGERLAPHLWHLNVGDHRIHPRYGSRGQLERFEPIRGGKDAVPGVGEGPAHQAQHDRLVIDDNNPKGSVGRQYPARIHMSLRFEEVEPS
jgi:hypothetical protein